MERTESQGDLSSLAPDSETRRIVEKQLGKPIELAQAEAILPRVGEELQPHHIRYLKSIGIDLVGRRRAHLLRTSRLDAKAKAKRKAKKKQERRSRRRNR